MEHSGLDRRVQRPQPFEVGEEKTQATCRGAAVGAWSVLSQFGVSPEGEWKVASCLPLAGCRHCCGRGAFGGWAHQAGCHKFRNGSGKGLRYTQGSLSCRLI